MKTTMYSRTLLILSALALICSPLRAKDELSDEEYKKLQEEVPQTVMNFKKADSTIGSFFDNAVGYAVLPKIGKGGLIVGGARGTGLAYEKGKLVGHVVMSQATFGAQIGGQSFSEVIF